MEIFLGQLGVKYPWGWSLTFHYVPGLQLFQPTNGKDREFKDEFFFILSQSQKYIVLDVTVERGLFF